MKKKTLTVAIALVLVVALAVGATYAYLTAKTEAVTNTFTVGKTIDDPETNFILKEHKVAYDANTATYKYVDAEGNVTTDSSKYVEVAGNEYNEVTPGMTVAKDPFVQIKKAVETPSYLFVEVYGNAAGLNYKLNGDWEKVTGLQKQLPNGGTLYVYKTPMTSGNSIGTYPILNGNQLTVDLTTPLAQNSSLQFNAYLCQTTGFSSAAAAFDACFGK